MIPATEGVDRLQMKSKSSMPWTAFGCMPLQTGQPFLSLPQVSTGLNHHILNKASCLAVEEGLCGRRTKCSRRSFESSDVVIGGDVVRGSSAMWLRGCEKGT